MKLLDSEINYVGNSGPYHTPAVQRSTKLKCFLLVPAQRSYHFHILCHVV